MAANIFERKIEVTDPKAIAKLSKIMSDETPGKPIERSPHSREMRASAEKLLKECPLRSSRK